MDCFRTYMPMPTFDNVPVLSATKWTASVRTLHMPKAVISFLFQGLRNYGLLRCILYMPKQPVITFLFQVLRNELLRYILDTRPCKPEKTGKRSWSKCYEVDCFGTYFTHAHANLWHRACSKGYAMDLYILYTCPNLWQRFCSKCYTIACFGTFDMPMPIYDNVPVRRGLYAMDWYILYTCPNLKCYATDCFGTYFAHAQTCDKGCSQRAPQMTASVHTLHLPKVTFLFKVLRNQQCYAQLMSLALAHMADATRYVDVLKKTRYVDVLKKMENLLFFSSFMEKLTVLPQRKANLALGVMALPHKIDAIKNQDFSKSHKYNVSASKAKKFKKKSAYAQGRGISRIPRFGEALQIPTSIHPTGRNKA